MKHRLIAVAALAAGTLAIPAAAQAHVTLQPKAQTAGAYTVVNVRVPNERDDASTTKLRVEFPDGIYSVSYAAQAGWRITVKKSPIATPVQTQDGPITERVQLGHVHRQRQGPGPDRARAVQGVPAVAADAQRPRNDADVPRLPVVHGRRAGQVDRRRRRGDARADRDPRGPGDDVIMRIHAVVAALAALGAALAVAVPALAHAPVVGRTPAPNSKVSKVTSVKVTFGESVVTGLISLTKGGTTVTAKTSGLKPGNKAILQETFAKPLAKGVYQVSWRALADDGHRESGSWRFTVS